MSSRLYNCTGAGMAGVVLDRQSVVPLYYQIQQRLTEQIRSGELKPGELVPSEQEISARLGVSRMTARQALKSLCGRGLAYSQRGKGTFVSRMKLEKNFRHDACESRIPSRCALKPHICRCDSARTCWKALSPVVRCTGRWRSATVCRSIRLTKWPKHPSRPWRRPNSCAWL
jgi:DNA-binding transcriptional regulator YhcF (GntR family)